MQPTIKQLLKEVERLGETHLDDAEKISRYPEIFRAVPAAIVQYFSFAQKRANSPSE